MTLLRKYVGDDPFVESSDELDDTQGSQAWYEQKQMVCSSEHLVS